LFRGFVVRGVACRHAGLSRLCPDLCPDLYPDSRLSSSRRAVLVRCLVC
jgi:hypothetical protein